jgi:hypothetical protein
MTLLNYATISASLWFLKSESLLGDDKTEKNCLLTVKKGSIGVPLLKTFILLGDFLCYCSLWGGMALKITVISFPGMLCLTNLCVLFMAASSILLIKFIYSHYDNRYCLNEIATVYFMKARISLRIVTRKFQIVFFGYNLREIILIYSI